MKTDHVYFKTFALFEVVRLRTFLLMASALMTFSGIKSQEKPFLTFAVTVEKEDENGLEGASVKLMEKATMVQTIVTTKDGNAVFKLKPNTDYSIEVSKQGYVTKLAQINTKVPEYENQLFEVAFPILLFKPCKGLDYSLLSNPVVKLTYNEVKRDFLPEKTYDGVMREKLLQLLEKNDECIEEEYRAIVRKADKLFNEKKYPDSKSTYQEALAKRPTDEYVIKRIEEIDKILAEQKDADKAYKDYIAQADKQFAAKNYPLAKEFYKRAAGLKPSEAYPPAQIAAIDALLAEKDKKEKELKQVEAQQAQQEQARQAQAAKEAEDKKKAEQALKAQQAKAEQERKVKEEQERQLKAEKEEQALLAKEEQERKAKEEQKAKQAQEEKDRKAQQAKAEQEKKAKEEQDRKLKAEQEQKALMAQAEQERKARETQKAKEEQERKDRDAQKAKEEQDKKLKAEQEQKALLAQEEQARKARETQKAKEEQDRKDLEAKEQARKESLRLQREKDEQVASLIKVGDEQVTKDCDQAMKSYRDALAVKPNDAIVLEKIALAEKICKEQKEIAAKNKSLREVYSKSVAEADKLFAEKKYTQARTSYEKALQVMANEKYPVQKINEIVDILKASEKEEQQQYKKLMSDANKAFDNENFPVAKDLFGQILKLRPADQYSKDKLQTIESIETEQRRLEAERKAKLEQYNKIIAEADAAFKKPDFNTAKASYQKALTLLPAESYPKQKLGEIDGIEKDQAQKVERDYTAKIQAGDRNFASRNYTQALADYQEAQKIKPVETYPAQRIEDVNKMIAEQARLAAEKKAKDDSYNAAIQKADNLFKNSQHDQAVLAYKEASAIKPNEPYPFSKIDEISKLKKQKEVEEAYKKAIASANSFFEQKKYEQAKSFYSQALLAKPADAYATAQITKADAEISNQIKKLADAKARQDAFDKAMADADKSFSVKDYDMAKTSYQTALSIFPDKPLAKQRIDEIDNILKNQKRNNEYKLVFDEANALFTAGNYDQAKPKYKEALTIKPEEMAPADKIKEIDRILAQRAADKEKQELNEKNYNESIRKANDLFDKAQYDQAKKEYEHALTIMPNETYPKQKIAKIAEINRMLAASNKQTATPAKETKPKSGKTIADLEFKNESEREVYLKDLLVKYPPGISCEVYKESNRVVTRYVIIRENQANEIREVKYNWGGIDYTRNGKPITYLYFSNQIRSRDGEYFNKTDM